MLIAQSLVLFGILHLTLKFGDNNVLNDEMNRKSTILRSVQTKLLFYLLYFNVQITYNFSIL